MQLLDSGRPACCPVQGPHCCEAALCLSEQGPAPAAAGVAALSWKVLAQRCAEVSSQAPDAAPLLPMTGKSMVAQAPGTLLVLAPPARH